MGEAQLIHSMYGKDNQREVLVEIGRTYRVEPMNPRAEKNRGRVCTVIEFEDESIPMRVMVRFHDTKRKGIVYMSDLVVIDRTPKRCLKGSALL